MSACYDALVLQLSAALTRKANKPVFLIRERLPLLSKNFSWFFLKARQFFTEWDDEKDTFPKSDWKTREKSTSFA